MELRLIGKTQKIMSNPDGKAKYFGWPSIAGLQNGKIAVVASGYRYAHICPFGKAVISYSEDDGNTYTLPAPVIDTPLDDRDAGILPFGKSGVIVTSFNKSVQFQREWNAEKVFEKEVNFRGWVDKSFVKDYLDMITDEEEQRYLGSEFRISHDCGVTFGEIYKCPVTSPHGPLVTRDGTLIWVGRTFNPTESLMGESDEVQAHKINIDGTTEYLGSVPPIYRNGERLLSCEPHAVELADGTLLCHIRVQEGGYFTVFQSCSADGGKSWSEPRQLLSDKGGSPAHLLCHSSGLLISVYGRRERPYGIMAMFSSDGGETWDTDYRIYDGVNSDLGYPCSIELDNGDILTVFYDHEGDSGETVILQQRWRLG